MFKPKITKMTRTFIRNGKKYDKREGFIYEFTNRLGRYYSIDQIEEIASQYQKEAVKRGIRGTIQVGILTDEGYFPSTLINISKKKINLTANIVEYSELLAADDKKRNPFLDESKELIKHFKIRLTKASKKGGKSDLNDCLYSALKSCGVNKWSQPSMLKAFLGLNRSDKVPIELIDKVERYIRIPICVINGNDTRQPKIPVTDRIITLRLKNNHYSAVASKDFKLPKMNRDKKLIIYDDTQYYDGTYHACDDIKTVWKGCIAYSFSRAKKMIPKTIETLKDIYNVINEQYQLIKEYAKINPYKFDNLTAMIEYYVLKCISKTGYKFDKIEPYEIPFIEGATSGGYMFCRQGKYKHGYKYDVKAAYASRLMQMKIPFQKGELKTKTQEYFDQYYKDGNMSHGIYHCHIEYDSDYCHKFRFNSKDYYTNYDLSIAAKIGLPVPELIGDINNFLQINKQSSCVIGHTLFENYINWISKLKSEHKDCWMFKIMLSSFWGIICRRNTKWIDTKRTEDEICYEADEDDEILENNEDCSKLKMINTLQPFKHSIARMKPFLLSNQRLDMYDRVLSKYEPIRFLIDGFIVTKPIKEFNSEGVMGDVIKENEEYDNFEIINLRKMKVV